MEVQAMVVAIATVTAQKGTRRRTGRFAGRADRDWTRLAVRADA
jgi:hypothetical protein